MYAVVSIYSLGESSESSVANEINIAKTYIIVGGEGHTTNTLRRRIHQIFPDIVVENKTEAELLPIMQPRCPGLAHSGKKPLSL